MHTAPYDNAHDGLMAGYSVSNHAYVFLCCRKHGAYPFCFTTSMFSSIPMFCQSDINETFVTHKLMQRTSSEGYTCREGLFGKETKCSAACLHTHTHTHVCFISTCNKKSQDHIKCPLQCAEQPLGCTTQ